VFPQRKYGHNIGRNEGELSGKGVEVLDEARGTAGLGVDCVQFFDVGDLASGTFQCADCGYGISVQVALPLCPMCGGTSWERVFRWESLERRLGR
jgi:rubrerythrin